MFMKAGHMQEYTYTHSQRTYGLLYIWALHIQIHKCVFSGAANSP